jgi:hypothetical protein
VLRVANVYADASSVNLSDPSNNIGQISGRSTGSFRIGNATALSVGTVDGVSGINAAGSSVDLRIFILTQTQAIIADELQVRTNRGMTLNNAGNQVNTFTTLANATAGDLVFRNSVNATFTGLVQSAGRIDIGNTGSVTLGSGPASAPRAPPGAPLRRRPLSAW